MYTYMYIYLADDYGSRVQDSGTDFPLSGGAESPLANQTRPGSNPENLLMLTILWLEPFLNASIAH